MVMVIKELSSKKDSNVMFNKLTLESREIIKKKKNLITGDLGKRNIKI